MLWEGRLIKREDDSFEDGQYEEPSPEDFEYTEEEIQETVEREARRRKRGRFIGIIVAVLLILQGGYSLLQLLSKDSIELARTSEQLSQSEEIASLKEAVVTIRGEQNKGTGFSIHPDGYILSNHHVVHKHGPLAVIFPSGEIYHGKVIDSNEELDIALLKIDGENLPSLSMNFNPIEVNESIYVIGNPLSQTQIVNQGEVINDEYPFQVMRISASIFPGHSGSPVLSKDGEVIGVVYARTVPGFRSEEDSYGLAVPMERIITEFPILKELNES